MKHAYMLSDRFIQLARRQEFYVDGANLPEVDFDAGPSWAGLMPISSHPDETRKVSSLSL